MNTSEQTAWSDEQLNTLDLIYLNTHGNPLATMEQHDMAMRDIASVQSISDRYVYASYWADSLSWGLTIYGVEFVERLKQLAS